MQIKKYTKLKSEKDFTKQYALLDLIGTGDFSKIYLCKHQRTNIECAVKIYQKDDINQSVDFFQRSLDTLEKVNHWNIPRIFHLFESDEKIYIVMEVLKKGNLDTVLY